MPSDSILSAPTGQTKPADPLPAKEDVVAAATAAGENAISPAPIEIAEGLRKPAVENQQALPRLGMFSDMPDRGLFIGFVTLGFVLIFTTKIGLSYLGFQGDYSITIACAAAIVMIAYGVLAYRMPAVRLRPDRLGDNFYYMGFVFTLASMSAALVQLQGGRDVDALIGGFGVALFSTILGIAGRVAFVQMRTEVEDIEERGRKSLLDAASVLRGQLGAATRDLEAFRVGVQQSIHERLTESADTFSKMAEGQVQRIKETVEGTIGSVQAAFAAHETAAQSIAELGNNVSASIDGLLARLAQTAIAFEEVAKVGKGRHEDLAAASAELRRVVTQIANQLGRLQGTAKVLQAAVDPATTMAESLERARQALDATASTAKALGDATLAAREASRELTGSIKAYGEMVVGVTNAQKAAAAATASDVDAVRRRMVEDLEQSRAAVAEVQKALADTARVVADAINAPPLAARPAP
jgi:hypothetical protein